MYPYSVFPIAYFLCNCSIIAKPGNWHCYNVHIVLCHLITSVDSVTTTSIKIQNWSVITKISLMLPLYTYTHSSTHHSSLQQLLICTTFLWFCQFEDVMEMESFSILPLALACFTQHTACEIHPHCCLVCSFLLLSHAPCYGWPTVCLTFTSGGTFWLFPAFSSYK